MFCEVKVTLTFDHGHQILIISSLSPNKCLYQIRRNSLEAFPRYHVGTVVQPENMMPPVSAVAGTEA